MPIVVEVVGKEDYRQWVAENTSLVVSDDEPVLVGAVKQIASVETTDEPVEWTEELLMTRGEEVYNGQCAACHQANGEGLAPAFPALKGSAIAIGGAEGHIDVVLNGVAGSAMAAFAHLSDGELAAVISYERRSWGNDASFVFPADVAALR